MNKQIAPNREFSKARVIALAYITFIFFGASGSLLGVAWPSMQETFGVSLDSFGLILLVPTALSLAVSFMSGRIITRLGIASSLLASSLLLGLGLIAYGIAPTWGALLLLGGLLGAGSGLMDSSMNNYFARVYGPRLMNWLHASFGVGATIGPIIMTAFITSELGWQWGYIAAGVVTLVLIVFYVSTRQDWLTQENNGHTEAVPTAKVPPMRNTLRQPLVWVGIVLFFLFAGVEITIGNWTYSLFNQARGIDAAQAGFWVSFYWGSFTLGRIVFGIFANRFNAALVVRWCLVGALIGALALWWNPINLIGFAGLAILGFAQAPIFPLMISTTPDRLGLGHTANAIGFQIGAAGLGIALVPGAAGLFAGAMGLEIIGPFLAIMCAATLVLYQIAGSRKIADSDRIHTPLQMSAASKDILS